MENNFIEIDCIEITQPISTFYVGKIKWQDLLKIAKRDIERIRQEGEGSIDGYFGIQRELSKNRLKEISEYVSFDDATFPNSIVLSIDSINYDEETEEVTENIISFKNNKLILRNDGQIAKIIDGQHRVFGLEMYSQKDPLFSQEKQFDLIVTIFIDIDEEYQSNIFATINKAQTKVNKSLVYDLYSLAKTRSPQRTAHNVIKLLNEDSNSPFHYLIKRLGKAEFRSETIAQATFADSIIRYISSNPSLDRNDLRTGEKLNPVVGNEAKRLFLRNWFIEQNDEVKIAKLIWNYFNAIKEKWNIAWGNSDYILTKSTGIIAFMRFLKDIVSYYGLNKVISEQDFKSILNNIDLKDENFVNDEYKSGGVGQSDLYKKLSKSLKQDIEICQKDHRFDEKYKEIPENQEFYMEGRRHQCAGCAYEQGYDDAKNNRESNFRVEELNISQAGTVRHRDPLKSYEWGYREGLTNK